MPTAAIVQRDGSAIGLVIVVDDGVATGVTDTAALRAIRSLQPRHLVLAVPVCPPDSAARLRAEADEVVCLFEPTLLYGVGQWYQDFDQVSDDEVIAHPPRRSRRNPKVSAGKPQLLGGFLRWTPSPPGPRVGS